MLLCPPFSATLSTTCCVATSLSEKASSAASSLYVRSTDSSVPAQAITSSVKVPEMLRPLICEVTVNTVLLSAAVALPLTTQLAASRRSPAGSAGWMEQSENSFTSGAMRSCWLLA